jgi:hypothetical protein
MEQAHRVKVQGQAEVRVLAVHPAGALDKAQAGARVRAQAGVLDKVKAEALEKAAEAGNKLYLKSLLIERRYTLCQVLMEQALRVKGP